MIIASLKEPLEFVAQNVILNLILSIYDCRYQINENNGSK